MLAQVKCHWPLMITITFLLLTYILSKDFYFLYCLLLSALHFLMIHLQKITACCCPFSCFGSYLHIIYACIVYILNKTLIDKHFIRLCSIKNIFKVYKRQKQSSQVLLTSYQSSVLASLFNCIMVIVMMFTSRIF